MGRKRCETCGELLYFKPGSNGKPTPFEVDSDERHDCYLPRSNRSARLSSREPMLSATFHDASPGLATSPALNRPSAWIFLIPIGAIVILIMFVLTWINHMIETFTNFLSPS